MQLLPSTGIRVGSDELLDQLPQRMRRCELPIRQLLIGDRARVVRLEPCLLYTSDAADE